MSTIKSLEYVTKKDKRTIWLRAFHIWQHKPHEVAPLSDVTHQCSSCKTVFQGNYCPRCGQSAAIKRFSFTKALLLFLDVWGVGNRSMFRTIRDLMLRPGFMIRDYISGMQSAYFPPFKMFFLFTAFSLLVQHGFNFLGNKTEERQEYRFEERQEQIAPPEQAEQFQSELEQAESEPTINKEDIGHPLYYIAMKFTRVMDNLRMSNPTIFALLSLIMFSIPLYFFLRSSPIIPDLRFSEFVIMLVYTANAYSIYSIVGNLLNFGILKFIAMLIIFIAIKQFSGYSNGRILGYIILTAIISTIVLIVLGGIGFFTAYLFSGSPE